MLQPVMLFRISIIILLLWASAPSFAEAAHLTFGAAPGATRALDSENQARRLASDLAEALDDDVSVRLFDDQVQLGQWLNQFAMIDLGVMDAAFLAAHPGEYLVLGSADQEGQLFFVARQGATGDLPRRVAASLHRRGGTRTPSPVTPSVATITPSVAAERPPVSGKAESATPLILGLVAGRERVIGTSSQAEQLAAHLGKWLAVPVRARLFDSEQALADWFCRFRVIDLAIIDEPGRRDPLVGDYSPLQRLTAAGGAKGLLVARRDLPERRLEVIAQALAAFGQDPTLDEILASPVAEPLVVAAAPAPIMPALPQPPAWPETPVVAPMPAPPAPAVPPLPVLPPELPASPAVAEPAVAEPAVAATPVAPPVAESEKTFSPPGISLPLSPIESFRMPTSIGPLGTVAEEPEKLPASTALPASGVLPESAPPVETVSPPAVVVVPPVAAIAQVPVPEAPAVPAPVETVVAETAPTAKPELPLTSAPPQAVEEVPPPAPVRLIAETALDTAVVVKEPSAEAVAETPVPGETVAGMPLVLGLVVDREGVLNTPGQAEQLATHLDKFGIAVRIRPFDDEQELTNWFCQIRMIDLAVIDEPDRRDPLRGDACPQQRLAVTARGEILLAARQYLSEAQLKAVVQALDTFGSGLPLGETPVSPVAEPSAVSPPPAPLASGGLPEPAPPVETVPLATLAVDAPVAAIAEAPVPEAPAVPAPTPAETVVAEAVPETIPELPFTPVPPRLVEAVPPPTPSQEPAAAEASSPALVGMDAVAEVIAQPDLPQELRPPGVPLPRPGRLPKARPPADEPLLLAKLEEPLGRTPKPAPLLPAADPEPGVVYVAPFITLMVPTEVRERVFDQFIDALNQRGAERKLKFVILKQGLDKVDHSWLGARKHALGEIYGYVEDSGCCSTDLRTRVRLTYYRANQPEPALKFEYPVRVFFDHDRSTLAVERQKLADQIAAALVDELLKALQP